MNKNKETSELVCPSCGYKAEHADDMQAHLRTTKGDARHIETGAPANIAE